MHIYIERDEVIFILGVSNGFHLISNDNNSPQYTDTPLSTLERHESFHSLQLWVNSRANRVLLPWYDNHSSRRKTDFIYECCKGQNSDSNPQSDSTREYMSGAGSTYIGCTRFNRRDKDTISP